MVNGGLGPFVSIDMDGRKAEVRCNRYLLSRFPLTGHLPDLFE
jgi:hypothetical protein